MLGKGLRFVGLLASRPKLVHIAAALEERGVSARGAGRRSTARSGSRSGAVTPEEIAVSILAEMIAVRRGVAPAAVRSHEDGAARAASRPSASGADDGGRARGRAWRRGSWRRRPRACCSCPASAWWCWSVRSRWPCAGWSRSPRPCFAGEIVVEGVRGRRVRRRRSSVRPERISCRWSSIPTGPRLARLRPAVLVDARMAKRNLGTTRADGRPGDRPGPRVRGRTTTSTRWSRPSAGRTSGRVLWDGRGGARHARVPAPVLGLRGEARAARARARACSTAQARIGDVVVAGPACWGTWTGEPVTAPIAGLAARADRGRRRGARPGSRSATSTRAARLDPAAHLRQGARGGGGRAGGRPRAPPRAAGSPARRAQVTPEPTGHLPARRVRLLFAHSPNERPGHHRLGAPSRSAAARGRRGAAPPVVPLAPAAGAAKRAAASAASRSSTRHPSGGVHVPHARGLEGRTPGRDEPGDAERRRGRAGRALRLPRGRERLRQPARRLHARAPGGRRWRWSPRSSTSTTSWAAPIGDRRALDSAFVVTYDKPIRASAQWRQRNLTVVGDGQSLCAITLRAACRSGRSRRRRAGPAGRGARQRDLPLSGGACARRPPAPGAAPDLVDRRRQGRHRQVRCSPPSLGLAAGAAGQARGAGGRRPGRREPAHLPRASPARRAPWATSSSGGWSASRTWWWRRPSRACA